MTDILYSLKNMIISKFDKKISLNDISYGNVLVISSYKPRHDLYK